MAFERDRDFFLLENFTSSISVFMGRVRLLISLINYLSASPKLDLELSESHFIKGRCRGQRMSGKQERFLRGATSEGDLKEYNLTGSWRGRN